MIDSPLSKTDKFVRFGDDSSALARAGAALGVITRHFLHQDEFVRSVDLGAEWRESRCSLGPSRFMQKVSTQTPMYDGLLSRRVT